MFYSQPDKTYTTFEYGKMRKVCQNMIATILKKNLEHKLRKTFKAAYIRLRKSLTCSKFP